MSSGSLCLHARKIHSLWSAWLYMWTCLNTAHNINSHVPFLHFSVLRFVLPLKQFASLSGIFCFHISVSFLFFFWDFFGHLMSCSSHISLSCFSIFLTSHQTLNCFHPGFLRPLPNSRWQSHHGFASLLKPLFLSMPLLSPECVCADSAVPWDSRGLCPAQALQSISVKRKGGFGSTESLN